MKCGVTLYWVLSENKGSSVIRYLNKSYLSGGQTRMSYNIMGTSAAVTHFSRKKGYLLLYGLHSDFVLSHFLMVSE